MMEQPPMDKALFKIVKEEHDTLLSWMDATLKEQAQRFIPVIDLGFQRLPLYFSKIVLTTVNAVITEGLPPIPPVLIKMGGFLNFSSEGVSAITYGNTYFIQKKFSEDESIHFHEIIHALQWNHFGMEKYVALYALELIERGYSRSRFEIQADKHQKRFDSGGKPYKAAVAVKNELKKMSFPL
jgi:hypothetical protein